jgi:molybdopterin/thiamine biosynthesis adenylyltransferase
MMAERFDRNVRLFGDAGQRKLRRTKALVAGASGLGSPLNQHLALLGVGEIAQLDPGCLGERNRNRVVGARHDDPIPGTLKVDIAARLAKEIDPSIKTDPIPENLLSRRAFEAVRRADWVFGCFDHDGPRAVLNQLCAAARKPYIDLASDVPEPGAYGGRVCVSIEGNGCLSCLRLLSPRDVRRFFESEEGREREDAVYGIDSRLLGEPGPAVSPINGVIASLAAVEFMVGVTGMRRPERLIEYRGQVSKVVVLTDPPDEDCPACKGLYGKGWNVAADQFLGMSRFGR